MPKTNCEILRILLCSANLFAAGLDYLKDVEERLTENKPEYMAAVYTISCLAAANKKE